MNLKIYEKTKYNNIYKHKENGTYAVDLSLGYDASGKRIRTTKTGILSEKEAKKVLSDEELKRTTKNNIVNISLFEDCINEYYDWCILSKTVKKETLKKKKCRFDNHILPYFQKMKLEKIGENEILNWHVYLDKKDLTDETKKTLHKQLSAYFNWLLIHKRVISFNPCLAVKNYSTQKKSIEYRTKEDVELLLSTIINDTKKSEEIKLRIYSIASTLFYSGFRIGELLGLKIKDFDFDIINNDHIPNDISIIKINLARTVYYSSTGYIIGDGKTEGSLGTFYIGVKVFNAIFDYIKYMKKIGYVLEEDDFIFMNPNSNKEINVYSLECLRTHINYFINQSGIPHTKFKDFRSSHGTFLLSEGCSIEEVQHRLRHTKKDTTEKYYATFYEKNKIELASSIDKYL